jgi:hypothetical protein
MDPASENVATALTVLAECREQLAALTRNLRSRSGVNSAQHDLDARAYESGSVIEMFAEAELASGKAVVWGLDVRWDSSGWVIDRYVRSNDLQGQRPVREFPEQTVTNLADLLTSVRRGIADLATAAQEMDLSSV